ncbi:efflux RND transporter periplasmic adaptor subunit [Sphingomonas oryzagri]|uniref:Efflux RND transporter periplasmic adaptor subunit n=1 Tax=Sphingomonas oryzagri TaxID=3042314 RepID=A0ABT6N586_9SPHN|nr:efflux RND transporter periplasmic adaptor subunit [Sphingomonas oryzagri]MDH7640270.1 efflux RND transporter periplasmic adaptor subunit [Sphingomonas oryzagri]
MIEDKRLLGGVAAAVLVAALGGFSVARCTSTPATTTQATEAKGGDEKPTAPADTVLMTAQAIKEAGISTETIAQGGLGSEIVAQASVTASPTGQAIVTARAGGAVTRVFKRLGDPVRAGEPLAIVVSRDAAQIAADRSAAAAKAVLANKNLARERYLYDQKVSARVDYDSAQAEAAAAAAEARRARVAAGAANVTADGSGVVVASPISGRVTAQTANLGSFVQPETELFRVADPKQIQIEAAILPGDAQRIVSGDRAVIELPEGGTVEAKVRSVTPALNSETRQATAVLDVTGGTLQPGLGVRVRISPSKGEATNAIVVPEDALQTVEGKDAVFVRTAQGFKAAFVTIGQRSAGRVEIVKGLQPGQTVATAQAFLLKAELGKGAGEEE